MDLITVYRQADSKVEARNLYDTNIDHLGFGSLQGDIWNVKKN